MFNLVSTKELCNLLRVSDRTVRKWRKEKKLPEPLTIGRTIRWSADQVDLILSSVRASGEQWITHETNSGVAAFLLVKPEAKAMVNGSLVAIFKTRDGLYHSREFRTQTVWNAGPELIELSCEDHSVPFIAPADMPVLTSSSEKD